MMVVIRGRGRQKRTLDHRRRTRAAKVTGKWNLVRCGGGRPAHALMKLDLRVR